MSFQISIGSNTRKSPYFDATVADGATCFDIYNHMYIPAHFGDPQAEYQRLLDNVVMWDVAAERQIELHGKDAEELLRYLTPREIRGTECGQGRYVPLCDHDGTLINDPIMLKLADDRFWLSIADSDIGLWAKAVCAERELDVAVAEADASPLAVQGPRADDVVAGLLGDWVRDLRYFWFRETELDGIPLLVARSGWSKQGGFEIYLRDGSRGTELWNQVKEAGAAVDIIPGAPSDVERVESGLLSYGSDADDRANPLELGLGHYVDLERDDDFIGKAALKRIATDGIKRRRVGLILDGDKITGNSQPHAVRLGDKVVGTMSEAVYSPRLSKNIALALMNTGVDDGLVADTDNGPRGATICELPFTAAPPAHPDR